MYLSLAPILARGLDVLPPLLRHLAAQLGDDFSVAADCGAGVGNTSRQYLEILRSGLPPAAAASARVYAYEPLPENLSALRIALGAEPGCTIRPVAVSDQAGHAVFSVPSRLQTDWGAWTSGTSYNGFLSEPSEWHEQITVDTVRLGDEPVPRFDFVKLDLQGGEHRAILGLGEKLRTTKLLYVEHQLLTQEESVSLLRDLGFLLLFDSIAFGLDRGQVDLRRLAELGVVTLNTHVIPNPQGGQLVLRGYLDPSVDALDPSTLSLRDGTTEALRKMGVHYLQTDVFAIHPSIAARVFQALAFL